MAFTFTRLYVDDVESIDRAELLDALVAHEFRPIDPEAEDATSSGWCAYAGTYEPGIGDPAYGQYIAFGLRTDTLRIPPARLKHEVELERREVMAAKQVDTLNRYEVAEIKERVVQRLRRIVPPSISHVPVVLDLDEGVLWVFSASAAVVELVDELFMRTAQRSLTRERVYTRLRRVGVDGIDGLGAFNAVISTPDGPSCGGDAIDRVLRCCHLATEFLLWLWWRSEGGGAFHVDGLDPVEVFLDDRMVLGSQNVDEQTDTFSGGHPASSAEAREALRLGRMPEQVKLKITRGAMTWHAVLKTPALTLSGVRIPAVLSHEDDNLICERMLLLEQLVCIVDALLVQFIDERRAEGWPETYETIRAWAASDYEAQVADDVRELLDGVPVTTEVQGSRRPARIESAARDLRASLKKLAGHADSITFEVAGHAPVVISGGGT